MVEMAEGMAVVVGDSVEDLAAEMAGDSAEEMGHPKYF